MGVEPPGRRAHHAEGRVLAAIALVAYGADQAVPAVERNSSGSPLVRAERDRQVQYAVDQAQLACLTVDRRLEAQADRTAPRRQLDRAEAERQAAGGLEDRLERHAEARAPRRHAAGGAADLDDLRHVDRPGPAIAAADRDPDHQRQIPGEFDLRRVHDASSPRSGPAPRPAVRLRGGPRAPPRRVPRRWRQAAGPAFPRPGRS